MRRLFARPQSGGAAYYHRPVGGSWSASLFVLPATYRARLLFSDGRLMLVYGPNAGGLAYRIAEATDRTIDAPIEWGNLQEIPANVLPGDFGQVYAIYPESPMYQNSPASGFNIVVVGAGTENLAAHVRLEP